MKARLNHAGAVIILLEEGETARIILAAVVMAAFAMSGGGQCPWPVKELPAAEALDLPKFQRTGTDAACWMLLPCTVYAKRLYVTGRHTGVREVTVAFPRPPSCTEFAIFIAYLERALGRIAAAQ